MPFNLIFHLAKKAYLQEWSFFCTFTFSDELHTEKSFRKSLRNTFKHFVARKGWKHIGVWERGGENGRLHFHGIFYIPPGGMVGEIVETKDYSTKDHRMQTAHQNTYFLERYGRNDFQALGSPMEVQHFVRRYFCGGKDFEKTMKSIAVQHTTNY